MCRQIKSVKLINSHSVFCSMCVCVRERRGLNLRVCGVCSHACMLTDVCVVTAFLWICIGLFFLRHPHNLKMSVETVK